MSLDWQLEQHPNMILITLPSHICNRNVARLRQGLEELAVARRSAIVVDCQSLLSMNSGGLSFLRDLIGKTNQCEGRVVLCHVSPAITSLLEMCGLNRFLETVADRQHAMERINQRWHQ